jgi:hypothetical protein
MSWSAAQLLAEVFSFHSMLQFSASALIFFSSMAGTCVKLQLNT